MLHVIISVRATNYFQSVPLEIMSNINQESQFMTHRCKGQNLDCVRIKNKKNKNVLQVLIFLGQYGSMKNRYSGVIT